MKQFLIVVLVAVLFGGVYLFINNRDVDVNTTTDLPSPSQVVDALDESQTDDSVDGEEEEMSSSDDFEVDDSNEGMEDMSEGSNTNDTEQDDMSVESGDDTSPSQESTDPPAPNSDVVLDITGHNFGYSQDEIRVKEGDTVTINFTSTEGFHDWVIDEFDAATDRVRQGEGTVSVTFTADTPGTYEFYCSVGSHREQGMVGTFIVE